MMSVWPFLATLLARPKMCIKNDDSNLIHPQLQAPVPLEQSIYLDADISIWQKGYRACAVNGCQVCKFHMRQPVRGLVQA